MTRREEILMEMANLSKEIEQIDKAARTENTDELVKKLIDFGFTKNPETTGFVSEDSYSLRLDKSIYYNVDLSDWSLYIEDLINDEIIYDSYFLSVHDLMKQLDQLPAIYLVRKSQLTIKYDDGDLANCEIVKEYKLGS